jgi:NOL1/NOP2/fmu family ribosome biogenesis protein
MPRRINFLNSKECKEIAKIINGQWDADFKFEDFAIQNTKGKVYIVSRDIEKLEWQRYNIETAGMYLGTLSEEGNEIRLSIEGSQLIGPKAKKNVFEAGKLMKLWMSGQDIPIKTEMEGMVIVKDGDDYLGTGKIKIKEVDVFDELGKSHKEMQKVIINFVPKTRRHTRD